MLRLDSVLDSVGLGLLVTITASDVPATSPLRSRMLLANDFLEQFDPSIYAGIFLPRQWGLCPRVSVGAKRPVGRGPSLGDSTPAGAGNSQDTLHVAQRPTDDDGVHFARARDHPSFCFCSLPLIQTF